MAELYEHTLDPFGRDELDRMVARHRTAIADLERDARRLRAEFDALQYQLRYPGTKFLIDLEFKAVYDATQAVADATLSTPVAIETLPGVLHAVYCLSAYCVDSDTPVILCDGTSSVSPALAIAVMLQRQRTTSPIATTASVLIRNDSGAERQVAVKVWRRLGMGGASA